MCVMDTSVTNWWLLFTIAFIFGGFYLISRQDGPITLGGNSISPSSLYAAYCGASLVLLLFSGATGTIFWIIGKMRRLGIETYHVIALDMVEADPIHCFVTL